MTDSQTAGGRIAALVEAVYPLIELLERFDSESRPSDCCCRDAPEGSAIADTYVMVRNSLTQGLDALEMVNNGKQNRTFCLAAEAGLREALKMLPELAGDAA